MLYVDPPSGWMYGFPKPYINPDDKPIDQWLVESGYPQEEINKQSLRHLRWITIEDSDLRHRDQRS